MRTLYLLLVFALFAVNEVVNAQTLPFTATWSFEGDDTGTSSNSLVSTSNVSYVSVNKFGPNPYTSGYVGLSVNVQNWSTSLCNQTEYVQFSVQPGGTPNPATLTFSLLTFAFSRSQNGPQQISVRSSIDGFANDIYSQSVTTSYQTASISLSGSAFSNVSGPVTFRIYACSPISGGATLHLDEIQLNGQSLPVNLVSFTAKPQGEHVQINWETTWEQNADLFEIQRSQNLGEFTTVGKVIAKGNTDQRQYYSFRDEHPLDGANYYRLKQIDRDGQIAHSKIMSVVMDELTPSLELLENPTDGQAIQLAVRNLQGAAYYLTTLLGNEIPLSVISQMNNTVLLIPIQPLNPGIYLLRAQSQYKRLAQKVVVR
ncbi:T9SS type A sorting domain-containing protein [Spirosoma sp. SC4-14]|uniref:T9SS type A sorting domain-containing protein n=1 Tax=Spirosoma sp. SC4-14 TaxID=3128900 RepID=UPI0030D4229B